VENQGFKGFDFALSTNGKRSENRLWVLKGCLRSTGRDRSQNALVSPRATLGQRQMGIAGEGEEAKILVAWNCAAKSGAGDLRKRLKIADQKGGDRFNGFLLRLTYFRHMSPKPTSGESEGRTATKAFRKRGFSCL